MKKITLLVSFIACVVFAHGQLLVNENFDYTAGSGLIGQGGWAIVGTSVFNPITVTAPVTPGISYPGYPSTGIGSELPVAISGQDVTKAFTAQLTGTVYYSFLANIQTALAKYRGDYFIHLVETGSTSAFFGRVYVKLVGTKIAFGILNASGGTYSPTYTDASYDLNTTYMIVVKTNAATAASSLIINPAMNAEPTTGWTDNTTGGTTVPASTKGIGGINIRQGADSIAPTLKLDGIHVAISYNALFASTALQTLKADNLSVSLKGSTLTVNNAADGSTVDVYSSLGAKVQTSKLENNAIQLNNLSKGLYVVRAGNLTTKIML
ncbi:MAG: T9SS type A sorting domain-containing protein [Paludibacter sp.]|nr:T9SS type A sorting domain-containing protein [Paludibacter sp.]